MSWFKYVGQRRLAGVFERAKDYGYGSRGYCDVGKGKIVTGRGKFTDAKAKVKSKEEHC